MTFNIDQFKSLCTYVKECDYGEIRGHFGGFVVLSTYSYSENITIFYPSKVGWTHITYSLPNEYEKAIINLKK